MVTDSDDLYVLSYFFISKLHIKMTLKLNQELCKRIWEEEVYNLFLFWFLMIKRSNQ